MRSGHGDWIKRAGEAVPESHLKLYGSLLGPLLWSRGFHSTNEADQFLNPKLDQISSPFLINNMEAASEHLARALTNNEKIAVYADYDMDGMSGLALLISFFKSIGCENTVFYQPDRFAEGYGVHDSAIETLASMNVKHIITVDTGISAQSAAKLCKEKSIHLVITDHHKQLNELPDTPFVINPNQTADTSGLTYLSGAGVAFYLAIGIRAKLRAAGFFKNKVEPDLRELLDLFVLGTIADHVDLVGDNRILVRAGLRILVSSDRPGVKALREKTLPQASLISSRDVAFSVTPKLNAASRLGQAHLSTELLTTENYERAQELAKILLDLNEKRSQIQSEVFDEAYKMAQDQITESDPPVIVVQGQWHEGVLGVVAAKLTEKLGRPSIVLTRLEESELLRGSMRTLAPVSCVKALDTCRDLLSRYGGHKMAAGLQLDHKIFESFTERIWAKTKSFLESWSEFEPLHFDDELPSKFAMEDVEALDGASPWGNGNPEPLFRIQGLEIAQLKVLSGQHLKCQLNDNRTLIGFFKNEEFERLKKSGASHFDALVTPEINRFRNQKNIQLRLHYVRPSEATHSLS
jgi:single-stranded-DNA-specific exonuclease